MCRIAQVAPRRRAAERRQSIHFDRAPRRGRENDRGNPPAERHKADSRRCEWASKDKKECRATSPNQPIARHANRGAARDRSTPDTSTGRATSIELCDDAPDSSQLQPTTESNAIRSFVHTWGYRSKRQPERI